MLYGQGGKGKREREKLWGGGTPRFKDRFMGKSLLVYLVVDDRRQNEEGEGKEGNT